MYSVHLVCVSCVGRWTTYHHEIMLLAYTKQLSQTKVILYEDYKQAKIAACPVY